MFSAHSVRATALTWDTSIAADSVITDGDGTWTTGAGSWNNGTTSSGINWTAGDTATFTGATGGTITVAAGGVSQGGLIFAGNGNYTFSGGAITGAGGLTKNTGTGAVTLSSANTLTGSISVNSGTLALVGGSLNNLAGNVVVTAGGLTLDGGSLITSSSNTYSGTTTGGINIGGTIKISGSSVLTRSSTTGYSSIGLNGATTWTQTGGTVTINGQGLDVRSNTVFDITGGSFTAGGGIVLAASNVVGLGSTLNVNTAGSLATSTLYFNHTAGSIPNGKSIVNLGTGGTITVDAIAAGNGTGHIMNFNGGVLKASAANGNWFLAYSNMTAYVKAGGALVNTNGFNVTLAKELLHDSALGATVDGGFVKSGSGTLTMTGTSTYTGPTFVNAGTLAMSDNATPGTGALNIAANATFSFSTSNPQPTLANVVSGTGSFNASATAGQSFWSGSWAGYTGTLSIAPTGSSATFWAEGSNRGNPGMKLVLGTGTSSGNFGLYSKESNITRTYEAGELTGSASSQIWGQPNTANQITLSVGALNTSTTFAGTIKNDWQGGSASSVGLTKVGTGTLTLTGTNIYSGATTINSGILALGSAGAIGTAGKIAFGGGTLQYGPNNTTDYSVRINAGTSTSPAVIDTNGQAILFATPLTTAMTKVGDGKLTLVGSTAAATVQSGTLAIPPNGAYAAVTAADSTNLAVTYVPGSSASSTALTFGSVNLSLDLTNSANPNFPVITTGALTLNSNVAVSLSNTGGLTNGVIPLLSYDSKTGSGVFTQSSTSIGPRASAVLSDDTANKRIILTVSGEKPRWTGLSSGVWSTAVIGSPKNWKLDAAGTPTDYLEGDLVLFDDTAAGTRTIDISAANVSPSSTVFTTSSSTYKLTSSGGFGISGSGSFIKNGSGTVVLTTANTYTDSTTITNGVLQLGDGTTDGSISNSSAIAVDGVLAFNNLTAKIAPMPISGYGSITKTGPGGLSLSGANSYFGDTILNDGKLTLGSPTALGTGGLFTLNGGSLDSSVPNLVMTGINPQLWNADVVFFGSNSLNLGTGPVSLGANLQVNVMANTLTVGGSIDGSGLGITKTGPGTLGLAGFNTYGGDTNVNAGVLLLNHQSALGGFGKINFNGGTIRYGTGITEDLSAQIAAGTSASPMRIDTNGQTVSYPTALTSGQSAGLVVSSTSGFGLLKISGANAYGGNTEIGTNATLQIGASGVIPDGSVLVFNGLVNTTKFETQNFNETVAGISGTGIIQVRESGSVGTGTLTVDTAGHDYLFDGLIRDQGGVFALVKNGAGTQTIQSTVLTHDNGFTGGITINGGRLKLRDAGNGDRVIRALNSNVTVNTGATLALENTVSGDSSATSKVISGGGNVEVSSGNAGIISLNGLNTYTGNTTVRAGMLVIATNSATTFADSSTITISSGAVLSLPNAFTDTVAALVVNGVSLPPGTYDSATPATTGYITGSGKLQVVPAGGYAAWAASEGLNAGVNDGPAQDPDGDGISNLLEYVLGGHPTASDTSILPVQTRDSSNLIFTFRRSDLSESDTTQKVEISTDLSTWTTFATIGAVSAGPVTVVEDSPTPALDTVSVAIPLTNAAGGHLFVRLKVTKP